MSSQNQGRKATTIWNFAFLNLRFVISLINGVLLIPLYFKYIDIGLYGSWLATGSVLMWINLIDPGVGDVLLQKISYSNGKENSEEIGLSIASGIFISINLFLLSIALGYGLSFFITSVAKIKIENTATIIHAFRLALWGTALILFSNTFTNIVLGFQKTKQHGMFTTIISIFSTALVIVLLVNGFGVFALAYSSLFRGVATFLYASIYSIALIKKNKIILQLRKTFLKSFTKIFVYTFSTRIVETISNNIDLLIVSRYVGQESVTILDTCRRPIQMIIGFVNNITISMLPTLSHLFGTNDTDKIQKIVIKIWNTVLLLSTFLACGFILFNQNLISKWVGSKLWVGGINNIILCLAILFSTISYNFSNVNYSMGDIKNNSIANLSKNIIYLILLIPFVVFLKLPGILIASLISSFAIMLYFIRRNYKLIEIDKQNILKLKREVILFVFLILIVSLISFYVPALYTWLGIIFSGVVYALVFVFINLIANSSFREQLLEFKIIVGNKISRSR